MNYLKIFIGTLKKAIHAELYSDPKIAVDLYRKKGVIIGKNTELYNTSIDSIRPFLVSIGNNTLITGTRILTHDASTKKSLGYTKIGKVNIGDNVFIGVNCIILPNVNIGNNVIVGAGTVVSKDIPDNVIVAGAPMKIIGSYSDNVKKNGDKIQKIPIFKSNYNMTNQDKRNMKDEINHTGGFVINESELERLKNEV